MGAHLRLQYLDHGLGQAATLSSGDEETVTPVLGDEAWATALCVRRDDWTPDTHGLSQYLGEALLIGGQDEGTRTSSELQGVLDPPDGLGDVVEAEPSNAFLGRRPTGTLADNEEPCLVGDENVGEGVDE